MGVTRFELMLYTGAKEIHDGAVVFIGFHWPFLIGRIARRLHARNAIFVYENGIIEDKNPELTPTSPSDLILAEEALYHGDCFDSLFAFLPRADLAILDAPVVDRYGNVNTTCIGKYRQPKVRLPGAGGGTEVASLARRTLLVTSTEGKGRFPEKVDYVTSPGWLSGRQMREKSGYTKDSGPYALISTLGKFAFDRKTKELVLACCYPDFPMHEIQTHFGWRLKVSKPLRQISIPSKEELSVVRDEIRRAGMRHYNLPS